MKIPRIGETWEIKLPGKRKITKTLGSVVRTWRRSEKSKRQYGGVIRPLIAFVRRNKGRHTGVFPRTLLTYGKLISERPACPKCGGFPVDYSDGRLKCKNEHYFYKREPQNKRLHKSAADVRKN
jgi:hypothetical protein